MVRMGTPSPFRSPFPL
ncbi:hypothetical protein KIPB_013100, partial [Kipferlia bialata]|eukprot:g13100.t1